MSNANRDQNNVPVALGQSSTDATNTLPFKIDSSTGRLLADVPGTGVITGTIADTQVAYGTDTDEIGGSADFIWNDTTKLLTLTNDTDGTAVATFSAFGIEVTTPDSGFSIEAGSGDTTEAGGNLNFSAGSGGGTSGLGGSISITAGSAQGGNSDGGGLTLIAGNKTGAGTVGVWTAIQRAGVYSFSDADNDYLGILNFDSVDTSDKTFTFPNTTGAVVIDGATQTLTAKTLTAPKFASGGFIADANGNELIIFTTTASAENEVTFANGSTGVNPLFTASGETNVGIDFLAKGTGTFNLKGNATQAAELRLYEDTDAGTNYTAFKVGSQAGDITYTLPTDDGDADQVLSTNGSGVLDWVTSSSGAVVAATISLSAADILAIHTGTGKTLVAAQGSNTIVQLLSLIFSLDAGATPFANGGFLTPVYIGDNITPDILLGVSNTYVNSATDVVVECRNNDNTIDITEGINQIVALKSDTAFINGNGTAKVFITYQIITGLT